MKNLLIAVGWIGWAVIGQYWLRLDQQPELVQDWIALNCLAYLHGTGVFWVTLKWQLWRERKLLRELEEDIERQHDGIVTDMRAAGMNELADAMERAARNRRGSAR